MNLPIPRYLTSEEQLVKKHFEACIEAKIENYRSDAYDRGRWARRLFRFACLDSLTVRTGKGTMSLNESGTLTVVTLFPPLLELRTLWMGNVCLRHHINSMGREDA